jgi:phage-related protein
MGARCDELCIHEERRAWRVMYRVDDDAIVTAEVFAKTTPQTPPAVIRQCQK